MEELLKKLIEEVKRTYKDKKAADLVFKKLFDATKESFDYAEAYELAKRAGLDMEDAIIENWAALMQDSEVFASTAKQLLKGVVPDMNEDILKACEQIQDNKNAAAGMRIKPQTEVADPYDLNRIAEGLDGKKMSALDGELATHACKTVDSTERANMDFAMSSGYEIRVTRTYDGVGLRRKTKHVERCSYCLERAGSRTFKNTREVNSSGIFARHDGCGCMIDYENKGTGIHSKNIQNYNTGKKKKSAELKGSAENVERNLNRYRDDIKNAENVTDKWIDENHRKNSIRYLDNWSVNGNSYNVDGRSVVQDHDLQEIKVAKIIAEELGGNIDLVPRIVYPMHIQTPDLVFRSERFDIKHISGDSKDVVFNAVHNKKEQAHSFILATENADKTDFSKKIERVYTSKYTSWVDHIIWVNNGHVSAVFERKK